MSVVADLPVHCSDCRHHLAVVDGLDLSAVGSLMPCPACGSTRPPTAVAALHEVIPPATDAIRASARDAGTGREVFEERDGPTHHRDTDQPARLRRTIDRQTGRYRKVVTAGDGEVLYENEHLLSQHRGRGDDRGPDTTPPPQVRNRCEPKPLRQSNE